MKKFFYLIFAVFTFFSCSELNFKNGKTGNVNFSINSEDLRSVIAARNGGEADAAQYRLTVSLKGDYTDSQSIDFSLMRDNYVFTLNFEEVPAGAVVYAEAELLKLNGDKESVIIMTGASEKITVKSDDNPLSIKIEWTPPDTKTVTYSYGENGLEYYIDGVPVLSGMPDLLETFCFDNEGNFYTMQQNSESFDLVSDRADFTPVKLFDDGDEHPSITLDAKTNTVYAYMIVYDESDYNNRSLKICKCPSLINKAEAAGTVKTYTLQAKYIDSNNRPGIAFPELCTVYDGTVYFIACNDNYRLYSQKLGALADYTISTGKVLSGLPESNITDMIYQDGYIYLLIRRVDDIGYDAEYDNFDNYVFDGNFCICSYGGIIRINPVTGKTDILGYVPEEKVLSEAYKMYSFCEGRYYYNGQDEIFVFSGTTPIDEGGTKMSSVYPKIQMPPVSGPSKDLSGEYFYGPQRFIAVKPKKLVIADDGFAFYTNADDALSYKNVNRLVTVDLEKFAISATQETGQSFAEEFSNTIRSSQLSYDSSFWSNFFDSSCYNAYNTPDSSHYFVGNVAGSMCLCIPNGDNQ